MRHQWQTQMFIPRVSVFINRRFARRGIGNGFAAFISRVSVRRCRLRSDRFAGTGEMDGWSGGAESAGVEVGSGQSRQGPGSEGWKWSEPSEVGIGKSRSRQGPGLEVAGAGKGQGWKDPGGGGGFDGRTERSHDHDHRAAAAGDGRTERPPWPPSWCGSRRRPPVRAARRRSAPSTENPAPVAKLIY